MSSEQEVNIELPIFFAAPRVHLNLSTGLSAITSDTYGTTRTEYDETHGNIPFMKVKSKFPD